MKNVCGGEYMERGRRVALIKILKKVNEKVLVRSQPFSVSD